MWQIEYKKHLRIQKNLLHFKTIFNVHTNKTQEIIHSFTLFGMSKETFTFLSVNK